MKKATMQNGDKETIAELRQNVLKSQLSIAAQLDVEMRGFWEQAALARDVATARHLTTMAAAKTAELQQTLARLPEENDPGGEFVIRIVRALQQGNEATADRVRALAKTLEQMADAAHADDEELREASERAYAALDEIFAVGDSEDVEDSEADDEQ
jgi:hypothetical protein